MRPREQVLAAAVAQLTGEPFELISKGLNTSRFEDFIPGLRSKVARQFGSSEGLVLSLLRDAIAPDRTKLTEQLVDDVATAMVCLDLTHEQVITDLGSAYFDAMCDDPVFMLQAYAWLGAHDNRSLRRDFALLYSSLDERLASLLDNFLRSWGREMADGLSTNDLAVALTGLTEGLRSRAAVDPDAVPSELFGSQVVALMRGMTIAVPVVHASNDESYAPDHTFTASIDDALFVTVQHA